MEGMDSVDLVQVGEKWQAVVYAVVNLGVP